LQKQQCPTNIFYGGTWAHLTWGTMLLDLFALGNKCFPQGLGPICPKKVANFSLFEKTLLMKLPKEYILFFPLKMRI